MRIGLFSDAYLPVINGVVTSIETLRKGLIKEGHQVFVVSNHGKLYDIEYKDNVLLLPGINIKFLFDNKISNPIQARASELIKQMNLDIIHVHTEFGIGLFARLIAKKENIPLIYTYHTTWEDYTHYINPRHIKSIEKGAKTLVAIFSKKLSKPAQAIVTPSSKTKTLLEEYGVYQPIHVIPTGVDLSRFKKTDEIETKAEEIRNKYNVKQEDVLLVFVGRLGEEKSLEMVISAVNQIKDEHLKFMIVGSGPIFSDLQKLIVNLDCSDRIFLTDKVVNDQIASYYHAADAFISASMTETQGLTFIEAMACGLPLFASDHEVLDDLLVEHENGYYFHSEQECVEKLRLFLSLEKSQRELLSQRSLELVIPYSDVNFIDSMMTLYQNVLNQNQRDYVVISKDKELIQFSNDLNIVSMILENDVIKEYDLEEDRIVSMSEMSKLKENDLIQKRISKCLTKLVQQDYSIAQMREYLEQFEDSNLDLNREAIKYLEEKGFLDDERFIYELLERYQRKGYGKYRIEKNLEKYQFNQELLAVVMEIVEANQSENLLRQYNEISRRKFEGSLISVKTKIAQRLIRLGFEASRVNELVLNAYLEYDESISLRKDFKKISQKETDPLKIQQKLRQKGYLTENIKQVMGD